MVPFVFHRDSEKVQKNSSDMEKKITDPFKVELLDVLNETGGVMKIQFHTMTLTVPKELLQQLRDKGFKTNITMCMMAGLSQSGMKEEEIMSFLAEADAAGASPSLTIEAEEGQALNITSKEENPMVDMLVQALQNQNKEGRG